MSALATTVSDSLVITRRNLTKVKRVPDLIVFATLSPIMFVLLFSYVYAGSIDIPGSSYKEFIMAGIFAQTVVFGSTFSGSAIANDLRDGIIDRFRTLPMRPSAVLVGRTNGDLLINALSMAVMIATGLVVGWRVQSSPLEALAGVALTPVMRLRAQLALVKRIAAGSGVSYGWTWIAPTDTVVGLVPLGYADGVPRHAGNVAEVAVGGRRVPVRGRICMDQHVVELGPDAPEEPGDEVTLFGAGPDVPTAAEWAEACGTIGYEIVTRIGGRVPRVYRHALADVERPEPRGGTR